MNRLPTNEAINKLILDTLSEDIGSGDITTASVIEADRRACGQFIAKESGILCGTDLISRVYGTFEGEVMVTCHKKDGDLVNRGELIAEVSGNAHTMLSGERVVLNLLQHLSGIATATASAVKAVRGTGTRIVDTRKTTPCMRVLEKYAVRIGGGFNHRFGLDDGILIKDNHIVAAGGITAAVKAARQNAPHTLKVEIETETVEQVKEALEAGADIIMLDNMNISEMSECVRLIGKRALTEASGNMGERDLRQVAETGVDLISIGALTHSVRALDISLKFRIE